MDILRNNWNSSLDYVISLFNTFLIKILLPKKNRKSYSICTTQIEKIITNIYSNEILFPLIPMPDIKVEQICDIQMEHSHPIINLNVSKKTHAL
jgi:hypothetical protein